MIKNLTWSGRTLCFGAAMAASAAVGAGAGALADNTDSTTVTVQGRVIAPLEIEQSAVGFAVQDLASQRDARSELTLDCASSDPCGRLRITGQQGFHYAVVASDAIVTGAQARFTPTCQASSGGPFGVVGRDNEIACGGTLTAEPNASGVYEAVFTVSVTYD